MFENRGPGEAGESEGRFLYSSGPVGPRISHPEGLVEIPVDLKPIQELETAHSMLFWVGLVLLVGFPQLRLWQVPVGG